VKEASASPESAVKSRHKPVGELLQALGRISEADLAAALDYKKQRGVKLGQALVALQLVTEQELAEALRRQGKIGCINLTPGLVDAEVAAAIGPERSRELNAIAINRIAGVTTVAMEDPGNVYSVDEIALFLHTPVLAVHAEPSKIRQCIEEVFKKKSGEEEIRALETIVSAANASGLDVEIGGVRTEVEDAGDGEDMDQPVINLIRSMLEEAYEATASDIHLRSRAAGRGRASRGSRCSPTWTSRSAAFRRTAARRRRSTGGTSTCASPPRRPCAARPRSSASSTAAASCATSRAWTSTRASSRAWFG